MRMFKRTIVSKGTRASKSSCSDAVTNCFFYLEGGTFSIAVFPHSKWLSKSYCYTVYTVFNLFYIQYTTQLVTEPINYLVQSLADTENKGGKKYKPKIKRFYINQSGIWVLSQWSSQMVRKCTVRPAEIKIISCPYYEINCNLKEQHNEDLFCCCCFLSCPVSLSVYEPFFPFSLIFTLYFITDGLNK